MNDDEDEEMEDKKDEKKDNADGDEAKTPTKGDSKSNSFIVKTMTEKRVEALRGQLGNAKVKLTPVPQNDPTFNLILTYISNTNYPKTSFQVRDSLSVLW